jgi:S1-C subfamily serine protease
MDLLYLRDQAIREGWLDTPRYEEAVEALRDSGPSLREELGDEDYDRFLHAAGRPNRVRVTSVFASSPGQIAGLQAGDTIVSYDGAPIRSGTDLRRATTGGAPDEPVTVRILRDGEPIDLSLLRGPIGIQMDAVSVAPD